MSTLIIGGAGFVGTALMECLKDRDDVAILDNFIWGMDIRVPKYFDVIHGDIRDVRLLNRIIPQFDTIVHLAGIVGAPACDLDPDLSHSINVQGTRNIVDACSSGQSIIFISSTSAYGKQSEAVTELTPLVPLTSYGVHKAEGEKIVSNGKADFIILRPATAFGISQRIRIDLLPNTLAYKALTEGVIDLFEPSVIRPFIHVHDFARVVEHAMNDRLTWNEVYNIGDPSLTMLKQDLAKSIAWMATANVTIREGTDPDQRNYDVSFDKLLGTGFKFSKATLTRGFYEIKKNIEALRKNPGIYSTTYITQKFIDEEHNGL